MMTGKQPYRIKTISEYHQFRHLPGPEHPLLSVINFEDIKHPGDDEPKNLVSIALKRNFDATIKYGYGQQDYDFDGGVMFFISPGQVFSVQSDVGYQLTGWMLLIHPDFFWNTTLAKK